MGYSIDIWPSGLKGNNECSQKIYESTKLHKGAIEKYIT
jgi:hypothetical protein